MRGLLNAYLFPDLMKLLKVALLKTTRVNFRNNPREIIGHPFIRNLSRGPDHDKIFVMGVYFNEKLFAQRGKSKQRAEQEAAKAAIEKL